MAIALVGRGSFAWLLAHEAKLAWRAWWSAGKMGPWARLGVYGLIAAVALGGGFAVATLLGALSPSPQAEPVSVLLASMALALVATLMLSQALLASTEIIYARGDLDLLFASPISPWTVLMARACGIAMNVAALYLALALAVMLWTPLTGAMGWAVMIPAILAIALLMTAIGLALAKGLFAWIGPKNTRVAAQILAALIGASLFLATQATNFMPRAERQEYWRRMAEDILAARIDLTNPIWLPGRALLGDLSALALVGTAAIVGFGLCAWWFSRGFVQDAAAAAAMGAKPKASSQKTNPFGGGGPILATMRKEMRLLRRDPLLLSQVGLQIVYLLPMLFLVWTTAGRGGQDAMLMNALLVSAFVLLGATLGSSLAWITASAEDAPDLIAAAPVRKERIELAKLISAVAPVGAVMLIPAAALALTSWVHAAVVVFGSIAAATTAAQISIWHQQPGNRKDFRRKRNTSWTAAFGQAFVAVAWGGAATLAISPFAALAFIPVLIAVGLTLALQDSKPKTV